MNQGVLRFFFTGYDCRSNAFRCCTSRFLRGALRSVRRTADHASSIDRPLWSSQCARMIRDLARAIGTCLDVEQRYHHTSCVCNGSISGG